MFHLSSAFSFGAAFATAFSIMLSCGNWFARRMRAWQKLGQPIRNFTPASHLAKAGTPTMGGILLVSAIVVSSLLFMNWNSAHGWIALASLVSFAVIGFVDDYGKLRWRSADRGLSARGRLLAEGLIVIIFAYFINRTMPGTPAHHLSVWLPFGLPALRLGIFYFVFAYIVIAGAANAANISDGLDGMSSKIFLPILCVMAVTAFGATHFGLFANAAFLPESGALYPVMGAALGAVLGFLWFNAKPAVIFMGDVGSLAIGGFIGTAAMLLKAEVVMGIASLMMVIILASSVIQTVSYRLTGKSVFLMAPLHHHFEMKGAPETKISERFFIISILFSLLALAILKS